MSKKLTIVVGGYIVAYPLGGMTWHHLNYLLGLQDLGHEVYFLEDSGTYCYPFDPVKNITTTDPQYGLDYLASTFAQYGIPPRYHYYSEFLDRSWGIPADEMNAVLGRADLLLYVSGVTPLRESRPRPRRTAVIDTDPVFTQLRMLRDPEFVKYYRQFDQVFTFGKLIGTPACQLPTHGFNWHGTNQPIALQHWPVVQATSRAFTTIGKWEQANDRRVEFNGQKFSSGKSEQWMKMLELPGKVPWEMSMGQLDMPGETQSPRVICGFSAGQRRRVHRREGNLHRNPQRLVQRPQRGVPRLWAAGGDAGDWIRRLAADRAGGFFIRESARSCRFTEQNRGGL